jgi:hypothetical protein
MDYMLVDSSGNALDGFSDRDRAEAAFRQLLTEDPQAAYDVVLLTYDRRGVVVGEPVVAADLQPESAVRLVFEGDAYRRDEGLTFSSWSADALRTLLASAPAVVTGAELVS